MSFPTPPAAVQYPTSPLAAVQFTNVRKSFRDGAHTVEVLRGISVSIAEGSFTAVMGSSGSGKSTFLNCAAGLDSPTSGSVVVGGQDLSTLRGDAVTTFRRDRIGFVFQSYNLLPHLTVAENVALPELLGAPSVEPQWQRTVLDLIGLADKADRLPGELSGGQAQRVAIARALITRPAVVFADEPTGSLDPHTALHVLEVLQRTAAQLQQTLVMVTHDPAVAAAADRVLFLDGGVVTADLPSSTAAAVSRQLTIINEAR
ncbi:ABC transporter [Pseudoclavibacter endophyticus]|uniref:ABC transporter ATP-binding protein n=1 Tax=Pseudoclavibacter endophyticus TaxID=1778590 RepID=A0A6H9WE67_9MICO|nr:ABC transporter ATP-binding protein [Pseudoclavibacter endophyticus]KAB1649242.1 ABC transporter ATP-binding protein [Pseudoclavibacter endophyticus]GGA64200.1 ABC transporter [Pseudoclavibacter endophyticus]